MLDIQSIVDLVSTAIQGGASALTKGISTAVGGGKDKNTDSPFNKAMYDNAIEIGRDISPSFGELLTQWFYGKPYSRENLRDKITKALADINLKDTEIANKISELEEALGKLQGKSYTVTQTVAANTAADKAKLKKLKDKYKKSQYAVDVAKGMLDDASTALYENKNVKDINNRIEQAITSYSDLTKKGNN